MAYPGRECCDDETWNGAFQCPETGLGMFAMWDVEDRTLLVEIADSEFEGEDRGLAETGSWLEGLWVARPRRERVECQRMGATIQSVRIRCETSDEAVRTLHAAGVSYDDIA